MTRGALVPPALLLRMNFTALRTLLTTFLSPSRDLLLYTRDRGHNAPLWGSWLLLEGSHDPAGIVNKVMGGVVHCPGMTLVDGSSHAS